jgi:hypothetical protein
MLARTSSEPSDGFDENGPTHTTDSTAERALGCPREMPLIQASYYFRLVVE